MIVRDAKATLPALFQSIEGLFHQIVVVDTGSKDGTKEWLSENVPEAEVYDFTWCHHFSHARNFALGKLTTDYAVWLDADDVLENRNIFFQAFLDMVKQEDAENPYTHAVVEYKYATDEHGNTAVTHHRERILRNPKDWEWREPIHEVCCYTGELNDHPFIVDGCAVVHKSTRRNDLYSDRNWHILNRDLFENPMTSQRTLYYIQKEALARKQFEYAVYIGLTFLKRLQDAKHTEGHYFHECAKNLGESFLELYKKTNDDMYIDKAIEILKICVQKQPEFNEPRMFLIDALLLKARYSEAIDEAEALREELPQSLFCTYPINYGKYKYAKLAEISIKYMEDFSSALHYHLLSKDTEMPSSLIYDNEQLLKNYMELNNLGVMYASERYFEEALKVKQYLIDQGIFSGVAVTTCVAAVGMARGVYFHFSDEPDSVYMEDGHPHLLKVYVTNEHIDAPPYGYLGISQQDILENVKYLLGKEPAVTIDEGGFDIAFYRFRCDNYIAPDRFVSLFTNYDHYEEVDDITENRGKVTFVVNKQNELIAIHGTCRLLTELNVVKEGKKIYVYAPDLNKIAWTVTDCKKGAKFQVTVNPKQKLVAFCAPGVEEWDGTTPFKYGIGASESSLVYLAEEFVKKGCEVIVYNTVSSPRIVAGVRYLPRQYMGDVPACDLFVASRTPEVLTSKRAKKQALWMHDLPTAYLQDLKAENVDYFIAVSAWEKRFAVNHGFPEDKIIVLPNGVYDIFWKNAVGKKSGRSAWVSQPERGIDFLLDIHKETGLFAELMVMYGFYNISKFRPTKEQFNSTLVLKHRLRNMGARICGRLNNQQTREVLGTSHFIAYPSNFLETQCVSALEAISEGVQLFLNKNGATVETANGTGRKDLVNVVSNKEKYEKGDLSVWTDFLTKNLQKPVDFSKKLGAKYSWSSIISKWMSLLGD